MINLSHIIKQHANLPDFTVSLLDPHEQPVDLTTASSVTLRMQLIGDPTITGGGAVDVIEAEAGAVGYEFTSADTLISGSYLTTITAVFPGGKTQTFPFNDYWLVSVEPDLNDDSDDPDSDLVFATVAQARARGYELSVEELLRAQGHIEVICGRTIEAIQDAIENEAISRSDLSRLKMATIYQAVWVKANPDVEERTDVTMIRTAGLSGEAAELTADGILLAPLARRCVTMLSWARSRSIRTTTRRGGGPMGMRTDIGPGWRGM